MSGELPIIDISDLKNGVDPALVARQIHDACINVGFFYIMEHGISEGLQTDLENASKEFFQLTESEKMAIRMELAGKAWRGYFPVGNELTSGKPDLKEGIYFGEQLPDDDERVTSGMPLHGQNLFPERPSQLRSVVLRYIDEMTQLGHTLMRGISLSFGRDPDFMHRIYTSDPLVLFRIFHYPAQKKQSMDQWGVGEHTDYGLLTILKQDDAGGLQVKSRHGWIDAPPVEGTFICNIGDMLDRLTGGYYRSTPHRVLNTSGRGRLSYPFFFDPGMHAVLKPIAIDSRESIEDDSVSRWDKASVHAFDGTYGDYLLGKVSKVFPELGSGNLGA